MEASLLFWVGFPCRLFCVSSRAALRWGCCCRSRRGDHPTLVTQPSTKPWHSGVAACNHGKNQTTGSLSYLHRMAKKTPQLLIIATNYKNLAKAVISHLVHIVHNHHSDAKKCKSSFLEPPSESFVHECHSKTHIKAWSCVPNSWYTSLPITR